LAQRLALGEQLAGARPRVAVDGDRADVQYPTDAFLPAGLQDARGSIDDQRLKGRPRAPFANLGGTVIDDVAPADGPPQRGDIGKVALDQVGAEAAKEGRVAGGPNEGADLVAALDQLLGDMTAEEPRGPGQDVQLRGQIPLRPRTLPPARWKSRSC